jgi:hypothetical protein
MNNLTLMIYSRVGLFLLQILHDSVPILQRKMAIVAVVVVVVAKRRSFSEVSSTIHSRHLLLGRHRHRPNHRTAMG